MSETITARLTPFPGQIPGQLPGQIPGQIPPGQISSERTSGERPGTAEQRRREENDTFLRKTPAHFQRLVPPSLDARALSAPASDGVRSHSDPSVLETIAPAVQERRILTPTGFTRALAQTVRWIKGSQTSLSAETKTSVLALLHQEQALVDFYHTQRSLVLRA